MDEQLYLPASFVPQSYEVFMHDKECRKTCFQTVVVAFF
ncbi:hypothetical protein J2S09_005403 [Bacillus fengqiuensis]|nr:hypothetical protein [Bacillus fengqiuensis]